MWFPPRVPRRVAPRSERHAQRRRSPSSAPHDLDDIEWTAPHLDRRHALREAAGDADGQPVLTVLLRQVRREQLVALRGDDAVEAALQLDVRDGAVEALEFRGIVGDTAGGLVATGAGGEGEHGEEHEGLHSVGRAMNASEGAASDATPVAWIHPPASTSSPS